MPLDDNLVEATSEANEIFERMQQMVERAVEGGEVEVNVVDIARESGLEIDDRILQELKIPELVPCIRFVPWHHWYPWRPLWCWWWQYRYPYYRCCHYWWYRCHYCPC